MKKYLPCWLQEFNLENLTIVMGVCGQFSPYIQAYKIFTLGSAYAVSFWANFFSFASMVCWLAYGIDRKVKPLIISNIFGLIGVSIVITGVVYYG